MSNNQGKEEFIIGNTISDGEKVVQLRDIMARHVRQNFERKDRNEAEVRKEYAEYQSLLLRTVILQRNQDSPLLPWETEEEKKKEALELARLWATVNEREMNANE